MVDVPVFKQIGNHLAGLRRHGIGHVIRFGQGDLLCLCRITGNRIAFCIEHPRHAAGGKHIVQGIVGTIADGKIVIACIEHIAALPGGVRTVDRIAVIGGEDVIGEGQGNGFALPCRQGGSLLKIGNLDGALFRLSCLIGKLDIQLHHILGFAGVVRRSVVGNLHLCGDGVGISVPVQAQQLLGEVSVAEAITKGIHHFIGIIPCAILGGVNALGAIRIVDTQHLILVAGLIILVANVDALGVNQVLVLVQAGEIAEGKVSRILHGRRRKRVGGIGDDVSPGGICLAHKHLCNANHPVAAGVASPQDGIHAQVNHFLQFHGIAGIDHHNDFAELAGILDEIQGIQLLLVQRQLPDGGAFLPIALQAMVQVALLAAKPADHINGCIAIAVKGRFGSLVGGGGDFTNQSGFRPAGRCCCDGIVNGVVHRHALGLQCVIQVDARIGRAAGAAVINGAGSGIAEQGHGSVLCQRQGIILVAQEHAALGLALDEVSLLGFQHLVLGGIIGLKISSIVCTGNDRRAGVQEQVHVTLPGKRQLGAEARQAQNQCHRCRQATPQITVLCHSSALSSRHQKPKSV